MITRCPYCDYSKPDQPLSLDILRVCKDEDMPTEDFILWMRRLFHKWDFSYYNGVKVHIGRKHKGEYNSPINELNEAEKEIILS